MKQFMRKLSRILPDKLYVQWLYLKTHGHFLHLRHPRTFNEKLQWYKLYYRDPLMTILSDKYEVRKHVASLGHAELLNELYGVYDRVDEIDLSVLPASFVLKATHGSHMSILCKDKNDLDWGKCRTLMQQWLKTNYFYSGRQWAYKNIKPRLVCEKYLQNEGMDKLIDYKFYCYHGQPELLFVFPGRLDDEGEKFNAYDLDWNKLFTYKSKPGSDPVIQKPDTFDAMIAVAQALCGNFPYVRVDLYSIKGKVMFGEFTFYPVSGVIPFTPEQHNVFLGNLFVLPQKMPR